MRRHWSRLSPMLFTALAFAAGCNQAQSAPPVIQPTVDKVSAPAAGPQQSVNLPPVVTTTLPPTPAPATFDVAALADQVRPEVVNITTTQKITARGAEGGMDPF